MTQAYKVVAVQIGSLLVESRESNDARKFAAALKLVRESGPFHLWLSPLDNGVYRVLIGNIYVHAICWLRDNNLEVYGSLFPSDEILAYVRVKHAMQSC